MLGGLNEIISSSSASYQDADKVKSLAPSDEINFTGTTEGKKYQVIVNVQECKQSSVGFALQLDD